MTQEQEQERTVTDQDKNLEMFMKPPAQPAPPTPDVPMLFVVHAEAEVIPGPDPAEENA